MTPTDFSKRRFAPQVAFGSWVAGRDSCLIVAEIGPNHDGNPDTAFKLVTAAAEAGCNAVKFQYRMAEHEIFDRSTKSYYYDEPRYDFIKRVQELPHAVHENLRRHAAEKGLLYLCSPFCEEAVERIASMKPDGLKVPSGEVSNPWLLEGVAETGLPLVVSSGMSSIEGIDFMMDMLGETVRDVVLLHCVSEYPTALGDMQLRMIEALRDRYGCPTGLSDHSRNISEVASSVALGASIIEVHFTFDRSAVGPDHHISLTPDEMARLVKSVRSLETALGSPEKKLGRHVAQMVESFTNSIVARRDIAAGETFGRDNLCLKKPGVGMSPDELKNVLGRRAARTVKGGAALSPEDVAAS